MDLSALMRLALEEAARAVDHDDVPIGAVVVDEMGEVVAADHNRREELADPTAHAELLVLRRAAAVAGTWRLTDHTLVVTLEPCVMCAGAAVNARIRRLVYAAPDLKAGGCWSLYNIPQDRRLNHHVELEAGVGEEESTALLKEFFELRRARD
jgi:tRNA(adenine34) deaminase